MCCLVCMLSSHLFWTLGFWTYQPESTQEEDHTEFLHLPSAVLALIFLARRIQPFLSLVDREVKFCVLRINRSPLVGHFFFFFFFFLRGKIPVRVTAQGFEFTSRPNVRRFPGYELNHRGDRSWIGPIGAALKRLKLAAVTPCTT